jgi:hypothetical protein
MLRLQLAARFRPVGGVRRQSEPANLVWKFTRQEDFREAPSPSGWLARLALSIFASREGRRNCMAKGVSWVDLARRSKTLADASTGPAPSEQNPCAARKKTRNRRRLVTR